jgi:hypothetical protein
MNVVDTPGCIAVDAASCWPMILFRSSRCALSSIADCLSATTSGLFVMDASAAITPNPRSTKLRFCPMVCTCCRIRSSRHGGGLAEADGVGCSSVRTFSISCLAFCRITLMRGRRRSIASVGAGDAVGRGGSPKAGGMNGRTSMGCCGA